MVTQIKPYEMRMKGIPNLRSPASAVGFDNGMRMVHDELNQKNFFPYVLFEITLVALFTIEAVLLLAVLFPLTVGREIDFSAQYQPRPEWYFLFLYQLTKYFPGRLDLYRRGAAARIVFSVMLLPPFLDSGSATALAQRKGCRRAASACLQRSSC